MQVPLLGKCQALHSLILCRPKVEEWLKERQYKCWAPALGTRQLEPFIERPLDKMSRDLLASDRKQRRLITGLLTGHCTLRRILHVVGFWESYVSRRRNVGRTYSLQLCMFRVVGHEEGPVRRVMALPL